MTESIESETPAGTIPRWLMQSARTGSWAPALVFCAHLALSQGTTAYERFPDLDAPMHFLGGVAIALFIRSSIGAAEVFGLLGSLTSLSRGTLAVTSVAAATVVWEFAEWTTDALGFTHAQGGVDDTMLDMALGLVGGVLYLAIAAWRGRDAAGE